jgi:hypothetical protein
VKCYACGKTGNMSWNVPRKRKKEDLKLTLRKRERWEMSDDEESYLEARVRG